MIASVLLQGLLTPGYILYICAVLAIVYTLSVGFSNLYLHPLRIYPGPKLWAMSRVPYLWSVLHGSMARDGVNLHRKYGEIVRIAPDELSYTSSQAWKDIYAHQQGRDEFYKDPMQLPVNPTGPSLIGADRETHGRYRRFLSYPFSNKGLAELEPRILYYVNLLIKQLHASDHSNFTDVVLWYNWITFDIIGDLAFGEPFHCLEEVETHPWIHAIYGNVQATPFINTFLRYGLFPLANYLLPKSIVQRRKENFKYSSEKVAHRRSLGKGRGDFWDRILADEKEGKPGMNHREMTSNAATLVVAGSETTGTLLSGVTYQLLKNPEMMAKLVKEVRTTFKSDKDINLTTIEDLDYMKAVMEEGLRIYPPVPMQPSRVASRDDMVCGKPVPKGTVVSVQHFSATHSPHNFHRAEEFLPQRWTDDPEFANDDRDASQPFSFGPRACIGRNLGRGEMRMILSKVLWNFDLELDAERTGDWMDQRVYVLWEKPPLWVRFTPVVRGAEGK